ncbi:MAG: peptidase M23 [Crocinitomicaceae bacterium]|nr:peptidase M23 [Crocinitomicaceae bacterium]|tara:strand:+ start:974 stop:1864 length:891 start_codon:yes stop_codon:yes gene_type:complete
MEKKRDKDKKAKKIIQKIRHKYRLVVMNDDTFEERFSFVLSPLNVFTWGGMSLLLFAVLLTILIAFTPLREFIPGYADINTRNLATIAAIRTDSMQLALEKNERYIANIKMILEGKEAQSADTNVKHKSVKPDMDKINFARSREDSLMRERVEEEERFNVNLKDTKGRDDRMMKILLFPPLKGVVTSHFNPSVKHYGVDVVPTTSNASVSATYDGVIIHSAWTTGEGHVLYIQHAGDLVSVYKHNSALLKKIGDNVKAGEVVAIVGNSGELSSGPHLHFELWYKGTPMNPEEYLVF